MTVTELGLRLTPPRSSLPMYDAVVEVLHPIHHKHTHTAWVHSPPQQRFSIDDLVNIEELDMPTIDEFPDTNLCRIEAPLDAFEKFSSSIECQEPTES